MPKLAKRNICYVQRDETTLILCAINLFQPFPPTIKNIFGGGIHLLSSHSHNPFKEYLQKINPVYCSWSINQPTPPNFLFLFFSSCFMLSLG